MRFFLTFIFLTTFGHAELLRLSLVADGPSEDAERMVLKYKAYKEIKALEEIIFIKKEAIITEKDVKEAVPTGSDGVISVTLTEEGGQKLLAATSEMKLGRDRLAVILDGKLLIAPTVQAKLKKHFVIEGMKEMSVRELDALAKKLSGLPNLPADETPERPKPPTKIEIAPESND